MADIPANKTTKATLEGDAALGAFSGQIETAGEHDWIKIEVNSGETYSFYLCFLDTGSLTSGNSYLRLRDANGNIIAEDDDGGVAFNSFLQFEATRDATLFLEYQRSRRSRHGGIQSVFDIGNRHHRRPAERQRR